MSELARKIIEAVQHSMLGSLLVALAWPGAGFYVTLVSRLWPDMDIGGGVILILLVGWIAGIFCIWLLGALARPANTSSSQLQRLQDEPANGFDVWRRLPQGGLRPSRPMRRLVAAIGRSPDSKGSWLSLMLGLGCTLLFAIVVLSDQDFLERIHPWLVEIEHRRILAIAATLVVTGVALRQWASTQRASLAPLP